ncbi:flagellar hook protein FlgE [Aquabacterium sp.]|uniref:flagellar hook protein FlgE n=1 Tax=Aquabacterium sp. TaxID=1872578 RepID=UPI0037834721
MAFQQGLSGLNATSKNLSVIGNNIANANTFGAKASRAEFADMYANAIGGGGTGSAIGIGVNLAAVTQRFTQGNITTTESGLDLAINGNGFFQLDAGGTPVYSRNGQFQLNQEGFIVNAAGQKLLGIPAGQGTPAPLNLPTKGVDPKATTKVELELNLDSRLAVPTTTPIDANDSTSYNNATSVTIYDNKGQEMALTYYFSKTADDAWDVYATVNGKSLDGASTTPTLVTSLAFDTNTGALVPPASFTVPDIASIPLTTGGNSVPITGLTLDLNGATQFGSNYAVTDLAQDGYAPGQLTGISIDKSGIIKAQYSNGQSKAAGQIMLATFRNPQGLQPLGGNAWAATFASGDPNVGKPGDGNIGMLQAGALEESNVDLTAELVNMITAQRAYQANAQSIKTEDQVMQTLVNLR